jgi:hypothetical protein
MVEKESQSPFDQTITRVFRPNHVTPTITVQSGWFTVHEYLPDTAMFNPLNKHDDYSTRLVEFTIEDETLRHTLLSMLDKMGINSFSLFPDLYGLSEYLEWKKFKKR